MNDDTRTEGQVGRHGIAVVNGPEDDVLDWGSVDWPDAEDQVRRLRQRIFTASQAGDLAKVRNLQKLMLRSRANALVSVRRVTERNAGRKTAGIDGTVVVTAPGKAALADSVQRHRRLAQAQAVKRVYIRKANGKKRPLGIPVIFDRALQAHVASALEPEWEARFEPKSYGFRPGRGCHDAIQCIFTRGERQVRPPLLGTRRRPGGSIRPNRPFPPSLPTRHVPRPGTGRALVEGRGGRARSFRSDRGRNPTRWGDLVPCS